nr:immunoglobulin heavy chain junction region [Macaca mulatta]MOY22081.1 immunoglobulin heavy chain junction region [Macaca mulatta]MOY23310.1 immunoglobulin heavy chain junction region [Macaca mulatta]MOY28209.1 immunoglobulin heavy chain junction region [Macaca mulatta]
CATSGYSLFDYW